MNDPSWLRLQSLFDAAIALAPAERESYLTSEFGDDTALRAQVEALIGGRARRSLPAHHRYIGQTLGDLGACLTELGRWDGAAEALRGARAIPVATYTPDDDRRVRIRERLQLLAERSGRQELALAEAPGG